MAFTPTSGFTGTATVAKTEGGSAVELPVVGWDVNPTIIVQRYFNSLTGNHPSKATTFSDLDFSIDIDADYTNAGNNPFDSAALSIVPGTVLHNVKLRLDGSAGTKYWDIGQAIVIGIPQQMRRQGTVTTKINCTALGTVAAPYTWTAPSGTAF